MMFKEFIYTFIRNSHTLIILQQQQHEMKITTTSNKPRELLFFILKPKQNSNINILKNWFYWEFIDSSIEWQMHQKCVNTTLTIGNAMHNV